MKKCNLKCVSKYGDQLYLVFRVLIGAMFFLHGLGKVTAESFSVTSLLGVAGIVEILVGIMLVLGLWTRLGALAGAITMVVAYVMMHPGLNPLSSGGELAVLYLVSFLVILRDGAGKYSLEKKLFKKEQF
jgi:putative oxidoreductase